MKVFQLIENEYQNDPIDDRAALAKQQQQNAIDELSLIFDKYQLLIKRGIIVKHPDKGSWAHIPETMALSGKWYVNTSDHRRWYEYLERLSKREQEVIKFGREAGEKEREVNPPSSPFDDVV